MKNLHVYLIRRQQSLYNKYHDLNLIARLNVYKILRNYIFFLSFFLVGYLKYIFKQIIWDTIKVIEK